MKDRFLDLSPRKLALLSGLLVGLAFPPLKLGILAWVGLVPFLRALENSTPRAGAAAGFLAGLTANIIVLYWLSFNSGAPFAVVFASMIAAVGYLALFWALLGYVFSLIHTRTGKGFLILPFLWVSTEYLMSFGPLGFPWVSLASTQVGYLPVIQVAEYTGIYGISFWIVVMNIVSYRYLLATSGVRRRLAGLFVVAMIVPWLYGYLRLATVNGQHGAGEKPFRISLVQPNVGPHEKWDPGRRNWVFDHLDSLYLVAVGDNPQVVVWPESATPFYLRRNFRRLNRLKRRIDETGIPLLTGAVDWAMSESGRKIYNGVLLIQSDRPITAYYKMQLVPLAEYNPLARKFPLSDALSLGHFTPGISYTLFEVDDVPFSAIVCFESAFPQLVRRFIEKGAKILIIVVNDGWFGNTSGPYQHASLARFRAVEHRMPVVRCANTGISAIYDSAGRMTARLPLATKGIISSSISPRTMLTFYTKHGDLFSRICFVMLFTLGAWVWHRGR